MKKLTLEIDTLRVDSFPTTAVDAAVRGTVHGHDTIESEWCTMPKTCSAPPCDTRAYTCATC
ncbi:hypothetical protein [Longimicrobium sp.]|uniref:hypothetical protein n=1 Tax=Longimicrobium sp. TaxID=2029185 RepID=UPI002E30471E|nr:hypothetical protein [Longimicrobium sp.]HEX6040335.1 hypothetical protein [Longimicrobium sp.]